MDDHQLDQAITDASNVFQTWKKFSFYERGRILKNAASLLRRDQEVLASLITKEMGKITSEAMAEVEKCAGTAEYFADHSEILLKDEILEAGYSKSFVCFQPIGVILGIMPWNFPFWQVCGTADHGRQYNIIKTCAKCLWLRACPGKNIS